jgi:hypothetical protein
MKPLFHHQKHVHDVSLAADVAEASVVPVQMWQGRAQSLPVQMWQKVR